MLVHNWLLKNVSWYRAWHKKPYANFVHFVIFAIFCTLDIYLAYTLWVSVSESVFVVF